MANNDDLLEQIGKLIETKLEAEREQTRNIIREETEPIKKDVATVKRDVADVKQDAARTNTALNAVGAGVRELREIVATKVDVMDVGAKVDKLRKRIEGLEETEGLTHKN